jgi:DNA polymerase III alpha subunit
MNRNEMLHSVEEFIEMIKTGNGKPPLVYMPPMEDISDEEKINAEYEALGFFVTKNPLEDHRLRLAELTHISHMESLSERDMVTAGGLITELSIKAGKEMAIFKLEDLTGRIEVVIFPNMYPKVKDMLGKNKIVEVTGRLEKQIRMVGAKEIATTKIMCINMKEITIGTKIDKILLHVKEKDDIQQLYDIIVENPGEVQVGILYNDIEINTPYKITQDKSVLESLESICLMRRINE